MRSLVWVSVLLSLVAPAFSEDTRLQQKVTFQEPAQALAQVCRSLSQRTGVVLFAAPPLDKEIVIVHVADLTLKAVMDGLAEALDAEWFAQPNGAYRLSRPPKRAQERRQQDDAELRVELEQTIPKALQGEKQWQWTPENLKQELLKVRELMQAVLQSDVSMETLYETPERQELFSRAWTLDFGNRWAPLLLQRMDISKLLRIPVGERRVFSTERGKYIEPLGFDPTTLLRQFAYEANLFRELWHSPDIGLDDLNRQWESRYRLSPFWRSRQLIRGVRLHPDTLRLFVSILRTDAEAFSITIYLHDVENNRVYRTTYWLGFRGNESRLPKGEWERFEFEWSPATRLLAGAYNTSMQALREEFAGYTRGELTYEVSFRVDEVLRRLCDPAQTEPHSMVTTDLLRAYARAHGKSLIALTRERDLTEISSIAGAAAYGRHRLGQYRQVLERYHWQEQDALLVAKPRFPSYCWGVRFDREGVSRVLKQVSQQGYPTLDDKLLWKSATEKTEFEAGECARWNGLGMIAFDLGELGGHEARWLGKLPLRMRNALLAGTPIRQLELTPAQRASFYQWIYYGSVEVGVNNEMFLPQMLFPDGIPLEVAIQVRSAENFPAVIPSRFDNYRAGYQYLELLNRRSEPNALPAYESLQGLFGMLTVYSMYLVLSRGESEEEVGAVLGWRLSEFRPLVNKPVRWNELPANFRKQLEEAVQQRLQRYRDIRED